MQEIIDIDHRLCAMMDNESLIIEGEPLKTATGSLIKKPGELSANWASLP